MRFNDMYPSKYLKQEDVPTPIRTMIRSIALGEIEGDSGKETKPVISFHGLKDMVLNKGNGTILFEAFGEPENWPGKQIEIYVDPNVSFGGKRVGGLRVRIPAASATVWTWPQAIAEAGKVGITKEALVAEFKSRGFGGYNGERDTPIVLQLIAARAGKEQGFDEVQESFGDAYEGEIPH